MIASAPWVSRTGWGFVLVNGCGRRWTVVSPGAVWSEERDAIIEVLIFESAAAYTTSNV